MALLVWHIVEAALTVPGPHQDARWNVVKVGEPLVQFYHSSLSAVALDTFCNIVPCQGAFSYTGGGAFCCAGNSTYDSTCCDSSFYFSQSDVGKPFVPASFNATSSAASIRSTVTSHSTATAVITLAASSTGPNAKAVGLAVGLPLGLIAAASCAAAVILYRDSQRSKKNLGKLQDARTSYIQSEPELHESSKPELHAVAKQGLQGDQRRHELH